MMTVRFETWIDQSYQKALNLKCPFWRRRTADTLESLDMIFRFLVARHKTILPLGWRQTTDEAKQINLPIDQIAAIIEKDWKTDNNKGYYITGKLTEAIYRDDCWFEGPDPDMPIRGLAKYLAAASHLFDPRSSEARLFGLEVSDLGHEKVIVATWQLDAVLRLPWKPRLPQLTGKTIYHMDGQGLIMQHEETWNTTVWHAFMETFRPKLSHRN